MLSPGGVVAAGCEAASRGRRWRGALRAQPPVEWRPRQQPSRSHHPRAHPTRPPRLRSPHCTRAPAPGMQQTVLVWLQHVHDAYNASRQALKCGHMCSRAGGLSLQAMATRSASADLPAGAWCVAGGCPLSRATQRWMAPASPTLLRLRAYGPFCACLCLCGACVHLRVYVHVCVCAEVWRSRSANLFAKHDTSPSAPLHVLNSAPCSMPVSTPLERLRTKLADRLPIPICSARPPLPPAHLLEVRARQEQRVPPPPTCLVRALGPRVQRHKAQQGRPQVRCPDRLHAAAAGYTHAPQGLPSRPDGSKALPPCISRPLPRPTARTPCRSIRRELHHLQHPQGACLASGVRIQHHLCRRRPLLCGWRWGRPRGAWGVCWSGQGPLGQRVSSTLHWQAPQHDCGQRLLCTIPCAGKCRQEGGSVAAAAWRAARGASGSRRASNAAAAVQPAR